MRRFGLVGLPNAGKSTLFNALAGGGAHAAPYAFSTTDSNVGVAKVPDRRLDRLAAMSRSRRSIPASVQFTDIGGLVEGASRGDGLGNAFLGHIRNTDAIVFVLRAFDSGADEDMGASGGAADVGHLDQLSLLEIELALADLDSADRQLEKLTRAAKGDSSKRSSVELLGRAVAVLEEGTPLYRAGLGPEDRAGLREFFLLTNKPVLAVVNIGEDHVEESDSVDERDCINTDGAAGAVAQVKAQLGDAEVIALCAQLESEAAQLDDEERSEILAAMGLGEGALPRFLASAYRLLGLRTFLTTGEKESRAWPFKAGATAAECAGIIHSDFQRGFIRADTVGWSELLQAGSWPTARERGLVRSEGKAYKVSDGDVLEFKFNV